MDIENHLKNPQALTEEQLFETLKTKKEGLSDEEAKSRLEKYGQNKLTEKKRVSPFSIFINQFKNVLTIILLAAVLMMVFIYFFGGKEQSDLIEAGLILIIVLMITVLGFLQEYKAEKALESLKKLLAFKAKVKRSGNEIEIDVINLVPGDIVVLEEGLKIPADIRILESANLFTNEASLTGESTPIEKKVSVIKENLQTGDLVNMLFAGTIITSGRGLGIVVRTGDNTEIGKIAGLVASEPEKETPLQKRLDNIGKIIGFIVAVISIVVFIFIVLFAQEFSALPLIQKIIKSFIAAIALAVAAVPEGLPAVVTISLAIGTQRMAKRKALIRKLNAVETLGSVDVICSDKTGTLTKNEMTVTQLFANNKIYNVSGSGFETKGEFTYEGKKIDLDNIKLLLNAGYYCNNAVLQKNNLLGDPTELALLVSAEKTGITSDFERILEIPFSSERKMMSVVVKKGSKYLLFSKGAPEIILEKSSLLYCEGKDEKLENKEKNKIHETVNKMNSNALRTLGFAYKEISAEDLKKIKEQPNFIENNLIFVGIQGMIDPPRFEVNTLLEKCKQAGIRVIMITGDHKATAEAVAKDIGIIGEAMEGFELENIKENEFNNIVEKINIYARINPASKMKIINALKNKGHIVAMTGDGVNDAPALKKADIGIAMGITGTDVAKEASEMVLLDDKFSTIVNAIEEGRGIYQNIRKFVQYLLSSNIGEVMLVFIGVILIKDIILTATMLLWINVVSDGLPAIALGMDTAEKGIMQLKPQKFQAAIITKMMWVEMIIFGILLTIATLGLFYLNLGENIQEARGAAFIAIVFFELVYLFIIRSQYHTPLFSNKWLLLAVIGTVLIQVLIVYVPFLSQLFNVGHIDFKDWLYIIIVSLLLGLSFKIIKPLLNKIENT